MKLYKKAFTPGAVIKDIDMKGRIVKGRFASFNTLDSDGDIFVSGCFNKSIRERGPKGSGRIAHLLQHDIWKPVGKLNELTESSEGLDYASYIPDTSYGEDTLKLLEAEILREHSVGFRTLQEEYVENEANYIKEVVLWEGSNVTWGANENTPFHGFKSLDRPEAVDMVGKFQKAIKNGTFTDDTFHLLEIGLEQLKSVINSLKEPSIDTLAEPSLDNLAASFINLKSITK